LPCHIAYDTVGGVRDKESTAITITLPLALDRALQALADQKHCGNKSAAIREVLYKEAGMQGKLRMNEKKDNDSVTNAEHRSVKYGSRKKKSKKVKSFPVTLGRRNWAQVTAHQLLTEGEKQSALQLRKPNAVVWEKSKTPALVDRNSGDRLPAIIF
jgi:hypothetical protein